MLEDLAGKKYINLQTVKKNGVSVNTPVWFVISENQIYVITRELTGKIKRIRNNNDVKIAICSFSGKLKGDWVSAKAEITSQNETERVLKLRNQKYGLWAKLIGIFTKNKGQFVGILIKID